MSKYTVHLSPAAKRQLKRIPKPMVRKIKEAIELLAENPRPHGYKKLVYYTEYFRYRVGNHRIIYQITDDVLIVTIVEIIDRRDAY